MKNTKKLFDYLDWFWFVWLFEIENAISDYFYPIDWKWSPSYGELSEYSELAKDYSESRQLDFDFDESYFIS